MLCIGTSLRLYTDVFEDLFIFGTILYFLCFAIFISCYINKFLYAKSFQPFHPQFFRCSVFSGPPYILDKRFLYFDNCIFILILLYFLVFCFSPKLCRYCFSEVQLLTIYKWWLNLYILLFDLIKVVLFYIVISPFCFLACFCSCLLPLSSSFFK